MNGYYSKSIIRIYLIFCHILLKITTLENPLTYKILNVRENQNKFVTNSTNSYYHIWRKPLHSIAAPLVG